ncbi:MAG: tetratricopeptide repeat protein [Planctomycetes bacterium]|nr:tetratricopeptide repeat protein [Planctomycetota bacterium]
MITVLLAFVVSLSAQDHGQIVEAARRRHEAQDWHAVIDLLLPVAESRPIAAAAVEVARLLNDAAEELRMAGKAEVALRCHRSVLALRRELHGHDLHDDVACSLNNVAVCVHALGRTPEALSLFEQVVAIRERLPGSGQDLDTARARNNLAACLRALGRYDAALRQYELAFAAYSYVLAGRDDAGLAACIGNHGFCLESMGRADEALPRYELGLAMLRRLAGGGDHPMVASAMHNVAYGLDSLGRRQEAAARYEAVVAMLRRIHGDGDHPYVAATTSNLALCLLWLDRAEEALQRSRAALAMDERIYAGRDHPDLASKRHNVGLCLQQLGRPEEALAEFEASAAMLRRCSQERDDPALAQAEGAVAHCLAQLGRDRPAAELYQRALDVWRRVHGDADHPDVARASGHAAVVFARLGRTTEAEALLERACASIERLRSRTRLSAALRQSWFDDLKDGGVFESLQALLARRGAAADAWRAAERGRGRGLLDLLEQQRFDPLAEAGRRARRRGDEATATRLDALRQQLAAAELENDRLLHELSRLDDASAAAAAEPARRDTLLARAGEAEAGLRQLLDERARLLGDVLPVGRVRDAAELQATLREDELLLQFTVTANVALLYVLAREGPVAAVPLPDAYAAVTRALPALLARCSRAQLRGRDPADTAAPAAGAADPARELFTALIPTAVWQRLRGCKRVFVAAHRELHRLPFELLVTDTVDGLPVHWLDSGPPIAYVPSGSSLCWLRQRARDTGDDTTALDLLAVGDPGGVAVEPEVPERGVFVLAVGEDSAAERAGVRPGDVLLRYDGRELLDDKTLRDALPEVEAAIEDGLRADAPIVVELSRRGESVTVHVGKGRLGIEVGQGPARAAFTASRSGEQQVARILREGDLERLRRLPRLAGARAETEAIEAVFAARQAKTERLLGTEATEPAVFDLAAKAKYLHFACHGIAEEYAGQSLSMLVLSPPPNVLPGDDGLLKLGDLLNAWRGRLTSCRLVVLSACRTNVGPTLRDEAPQALPLGFLFAGVPAVISSLWAVDDASTKELMTDFYSRLLAGETDKLAAFTAAKKVLRAKYPDPFHWAPFLYIGAPE